MHANEKELYESLSCFSFVISRSSIDVTLGCISASASTSQTTTWPTWKRSTTLWKCSTNISTTSANSIWSSISTRYALWQHSDQSLRKTFFMWLRIQRCVMTLNILQVYTSVAKQYDLVPAQAGFWSVRWSSGKCAGLLIERLENQDFYSNSAMMSMLTLHCQREDEMAMERTGHPPSDGEAKKTKLLTLYSNGCLRGSLKDCSSISSRVSLCKFFKATCRYPEPWNLSIAESRTGVRR